MKYIKFEANNETMHGILEGKSITRIKGNFISNEINKMEDTYVLDNVNVLSPVEPKQIVAIGLNYEGHALERNKPIPEEPMMFLVSPSAVTGTGKEIQLANPENRTDFEGELAIVIGKEAYKVNKKDALSYVLGYTCNNDISDRDLQKKDGQFSRAKSFAGYKPFGPVIETDIDPNNVRITLKVNGEIKQDSNTNDLIHDVEGMIEHITNVITLYPGDAIITGTPSGVAPLKGGDKVEVEIEGIGILTNHITS